MNRSRSEFVRCWPSSFRAAFIERSWPQPHPDETDISNAGILIAYHDFSQRLHVDHR